MKESKVILITGASSGIGRAAAELLRSQGHEVWATARRTDRLAALEAMGIKTLRLDVSDGLSMECGVSTVLAASGRIDVLINNAGYGSYGSVEDVCMDEGRRQFEVNVFGLARMCQLVIPSMRKRCSGLIINVASVAGKIHMPFGAWYHSTKHAVEGFSASMRLELKPFGINVAIIEPGLIKSEWDGIAAGSLRKASGVGAYARAALRSAQAMQNNYAHPRASEPEVIARLIAMAVNSRHPRTRYWGGWLAGPLLFMRRISPDRLFDRIIGTAMS